MISRLKVVFSKCIGEEQSAFLDRRQIVDNVVSATECFKAIKRKKGKTGWCEIKLDMSQAFDRIEYSYILNIFKCFGFANERLVFHYD